jgi:hypothetical protein
MPRSATDSHQSAQLTSVLRHIRQVIAFFFFFLKSEKLLIENVRNNTKQIQAIQTLKDFDQSDSEVVSDIFHFIILLMIMFLFTFLNL